MSAYLFIVMIYLMGFAISSIPRSWRALGWTSLAFIVTILAFIGFLSGTNLGFVAAAFAIILMLVIAGYAAGAIASGALILLKPARYRAIITVAILTICFASGPASLFAWQAFIRYESDLAYARLPAVGLQKIPACEPFEKQGPVLDVLMRSTQHAREKNTQEEAQLRYPIDYLRDRRPRLPVPMSTVDNLRFSLRISDASPVPADEQTDSKKRAIRSNDRTPVVSIDIKFDQPLALKSDRVLNSRYGKIGSKTPFEPFLSRSKYSDLLKIENKSPSYFRNETFLMQQDGKTVAHLECSTQSSAVVPFCEAWLERQEMSIVARFSATSLQDWNLVKTRIDDFADCIHVAANPISNLQEN